MQRPSPGFLLEVDSEELECAAVSEPCQDAVDVLGDGHRGREAGAHAH
ncbi:hypothetical protein [Rathayibacter oskolensis]|nr:hypothetical protein [Rathayibacter oskolensis]